MNPQRNQLPRAPLPLLAAAAGLVLALPAGGVTFVNKSAEQGVSGGNEACWFDFNNDGWVDLCAGGKVYENHQGRGFTPVADTGAVVAADYDNDGFIDLYSWSGRTLFHNDGGAGFTAVPLPELPVGISLGAAWLDYDNDGYVDLYVGGFEAWPAETYADFILKNRRGRAWAVTWSEVRYRARGVTACDFDRDADMDVYVSNYRLQPNILWQNQGDATFQEVTGEYNALATDRGFGGGHSIGSAWGDFDNDGHIDLFSGNFAHNDTRGHQPESHWLRNLGPGRSHHFEDLGQRGVFYQESYASPAAGDFDNDGDLDLFFTTVYGTASFGVPNNPVLFRNDGGFNFGDATGEASLGRLPPTYQAAWADYDNDGDLDLMAAGSLFENQGGSDQSWLKVELTGDGGSVNGSAIGAQVRIALPGGAVLTRQVEAGTGQGNQNDLTLHFGLGTHRRWVDLEVFWPDGTTQTIFNVAPERLVKISREPLAEIVRPGVAVALEIGSDLLLEGLAKAAGVSLTWSVDSAPAGGTARFEDGAAAKTRVQFTAPGDYVLRLTGERSGLANFDTVAVTVWPDGPQVRPVGWWKLDDGSGTTVRDFSGYGLHGQRAGFADAADGWIAEGVLGGALSFRAADHEFVSLPDPAPSISGLDEGTLAAWFRTDSSGEAVIFSFAASRGYEELRLYLQDGHPSFRTRITGESEPRTIRAPVRANDNAWHHVAVSCEQAGVTRLYLDGQAVALGRAPFFSSLVRADQIEIGRSAVGSVGAHYFHGDLDELRIFPRVLTEGEIGSLMAASGAPVTAPMIVLPGDRLTVPAPSFPLAGFAPFLDSGSVLRWEQVSGPGTLEFSSPSQDSGNVTFPRAGTYVLRVLTAGQEATVSREFTLVHTGGAAGAPAVFDIENLLLPQADLAHEIELFPVFQDPDDADEVLLFSVTVAPGGEALLEDISVVGGGAAGPARLVLKPAGGAEGETRVTVRAEDPSGNFTATSFILTVSNTAPLALPVTLAIDENPWPGQAVGIVPAVDADGDPIRFHLVSGNREDAFALDPDTGDLRVRRPEAVDFERNPRFDLQVAVTDLRHPVFDRLTAVVVEVADQRETPRLRSERFTVLRDAPAETVIGTVVGSDPDREILTYSIVRGDAGGVFALDPASGEITLADPAGLSDRSHDLVVRGTDPSGASGEANITILPLQVLIPEEANAQWKVPTDGSQDATWRDLAHDDSAWPSGPMGHGYDTGLDYGPLIATDLDTRMRDQNTTVYLRVRFDVADPASLGPLIMRMRYDDGFVAYLNGSLVAGRNAPDDPDWESGATTGHPDAEAVLFEEFDLGWAHELLVPGENLLAIHGLNHLITSSDFLLSAELLGGPRQGGEALLPEGAEVRWKVPADGSEDGLWADWDFDHSAWGRGPMGLGYDNDPTYLPDIATNVATEMQDRNTSIYLRARFEIADPSAYSTLRLGMKFDDGFVAFLNGLRIAAFNEPALADLDWNSEAADLHADTEAVSFEVFTLVRPAPIMLRTGENVLAIHGLNAALTSSDFLVSAELRGEPVVSPRSGPAALYNNGVSSVEPTEVTAHCDVGATGGAPMHVFAVWGRHNYSRDADRWEHRAYVGTADGYGTFAVRLRGLEPGRGYHLRFYAQHPDSEEINGWSAGREFGTSSRPPTTLVAAGGPAQAFIPASANEAAGWREPGYLTDPSRWLRGTSGVGFDRLGNFTGPIGLNLSTPMLGVNPGAYLRFPFVLGDPAGLKSLTLRMKYDDGFVAYLNGIEVARAGAPPSPPWNATADQQRPGQEAEVFVEFDRSPARGALLPGPNTLAIHGLNYGVSDPEFLIVPELVATGDPGAVTPFDAWAYSEGLYGGEALLGADPDRNGRTNFEEFAEVELVEFKPSAGGSLSLSYRRRAGLEYLVQLSENLVDWQTIVPSTTVLTALGNGDFELATVQLASSGGAGPKAFVRFVINTPGGNVSPMPSVSLVNEGSGARALVPSSGVPGWSSPGFDDGAWQEGVLGAGYEQGSGYEEHIGIDLGTSMFGINTSAYVRIPFLVADPSGLRSLTLRMKYDDGFVAYLNGVRAASAHAGPGGTLSWNAAATIDHNDALALQSEEFDLGGFLAALEPGENLLAIQGLNISLTSSDLLVLPELVATGDPGRPAPYDAWALAHGLSGAAAAPGADPERDGVVNFGEFAHGGAPLVFDRALTTPRLSVAGDGSWLEITFRRRLGAVGNGVVFEIETSTNLLSWQPAENAIEVDVRPAPDGVAELVTVRIPLTGAGAGFVRLKVR